MGRGFKIKAGKRENGKRKEYEKENGTCQLFVGLVCNYIDLVSEFRQNNRAHAFTDMYKYVYMHIFVPMSTYFYI